MYETFGENCSNFILKWFQPNPFGELCFLEESYGNMQKFKFWKIWESPLFNISEYAFKAHLIIKPCGDKGHWANPEVRGLPLQKTSIFLVKNLGIPRLIFWLSKKWEIFLYQKRTNFFCKFQCFLYPCNQKSDYFFGIPSEKCRLKFSDYQSSLKDVHLISGIAISMFFSPDTPNYWL